jgi:hypothetical protein
MNLCIPLTYTHHCRKENVKTDRLGIGAGWIELGGDTRKKRALKQGREMNMIREFES